MDQLWIASDGIGLNIDKMDISHVRNALRFMIRKFGDEDQSEECVFDMSNEVARFALKDMISVYGNPMDWEEDNDHTEDQFSIY